MPLTELSKKRLSTVVPELREVIEQAIAIAEDRGMTVQITEGIRTIAQQREYVALGKSKTMNSYHLAGKAVDVFVNKAWNFADYKEFAGIVKNVAKSLDYEVTWGGDWKTFRDGPHFQIES